VDVPRCALALAAIASLISASGCGGGESDDDACIEGAVSCTDDALSTLTCQAGAWIEADCWQTEGRLCDGGECVDPWRHGDPAWGTCLDDPLATGESLADKAGYYDELVARLHVHPDLRWASDLYLQREQADCPDGLSPPCYEPLVPEEQATFEDVATWRSGENDGLWSGLYLASQAYRYAVTADDDALDNIRVLLAGEADRMRITGVPGLFTRQLIPPGVDGLSCPTDAAAYAVDEEKDDNQWVKIEDDGCVWVTDPDTMAWTATTHCGLDDYAGWCWLDNVSQDEYAGHMFALGALAKLVDDPDVQATVADLLGQVGGHLMENDLTVVDWDGRLTEHGRLYPMALTDTPGYLALMALSFVKIAAEGSDRDDLRAYYDDCLLQRGGELDCLPWPGQEAKPFTDYLPALLLYTGEGSCESNWNNFSMAMVSFHHLLWFERDLPTRALIQEAMASEAMQADKERALIEQENAWFNVMWAAQKQLGPGSDGPDYQAVEDAVCSLRQFPASQSTPTLDPTSLYEHDCDSRQGSSMAAEPIPVSLRCPKTFLWWANPYRRNTCTEESWNIHVPGDYLLAYWMARYYGFVGAHQ
jgi:hypothetical protein